MKKIYKLLFILPVLSLAIMPVLSFAQTPPSENAPIQSLSGLQTWLTSLLAWLNTIFWILTAFFVLFAAFKYLTAQGDEDKIKSAKNMLIYAVIAMVVALFAGGIDTLVDNVINLR